MISVSSPREIDGLWQLNRTCLPSKQINIGLTDTDAVNIAGDILYDNKDAVVSAAAAAASAAAAAAAAHDDDDDDDDDDDGVGDRGF